MRRFRHLHTVCFLLSLTIGPLASGLVYAHDGNAHTRPGLSEATRSASEPPVGSGQTRSLSGRFHVIYGDAPPGSGVPAVFGYVLVSDQGDATELYVEEQTLRALGGTQVINHQRVTVTGQVTAGALPGVQPFLAVQTLQLEGPERTSDAVAADLAVSGPQPWATILCRFADSPTLTPHPIEWFNTLMLGTTPPGLDHYWRELSFNNVNLTGSRVYGWYTLPQPHSYYVYGGQLDHQRAATDCTAVANNDVYFPNFVGINLMFNTELDGFAWGGSWPLTLDGVFKSWRMTWVPPWGYENQGPIAHEMGHGFGLPHSSGPYSATYDSRWDVMSNIWGNCPPYDPAYACVGVHTIAYHKDMLGWIPPAQKYTAAPNSARTITMERLGNPTSSTSYLMAQLPIGASPTQFYTVEVRRFTGYDVKVPGEAVVIHRVDTTRSDRNAQVVDNDQNGNPNDAAAMWLPGETFVDTANALTVAVNAQTTTGFQVTIATTLNPPPPPPPPPNPSRLRDFNGDGRSDILLRHTSGVVYEWLLNDFTIIGQGMVGGLGPEWTIVAVGDFNGDGKADILLQHTTGILYEWLLDGPTIIGQGTVGGLGTAWTVVGVGDFNGDGKADILLQHTTGILYEWLLDGPTIIGQGTVGGLGTAWTVVGVGDFNGDGKADILLQHTTGILYEWLLDGPTIIGQGTVGGLGTAWTVVGVGDFNGDGKADVLLQHTTGILYEWLLNGPTVIGQGTVGGLGTTWRVAKVGDFNGDGKADLLLLHTTGILYEWLLNGPTVIGQGSPGGIGTTWQVQ